MPKKNKLSIRIPTAKPTLWYKDKSKFDRKQYKKNVQREIDEFLARKKNQEEGKDDY